MILHDSYGRSFPYLRLSLIQKCNLRCKYCYDGVHYPDTYLNLQEIQNLAKAWIAMGCKKVRLTGGEPTLRKDLPEIINIFAEAPEIKRICMTTNGVLLAKNAALWKQAGLQGVNISIDTLNDARFRELTQGGSLKKVLDGLYKACEVGFPFIKVNVVLWGNETLEELDAFVNLAKQTGVKVRYIELMETGYLTEEQKHTDKYVAAKRIRTELKERGFTQENGEELAGPQEIWKNQEGAQVGLIAPYDSYFCQTCNRLRVDSEGKLHLCLFGKQVVDLRPLLQNEEDNELLQATVSQALQEKPKQHHLIEHNHGANRTLYSVGG